MVNDTIPSQTASDAEVAAAQAEAIQTLRREVIQPGQSAGNIEGALKPLTYTVAANDVNAWVMVWEMKLDADGQPYGYPTRAPRGQLGLWLSKRRSDGGPRFQVEQPARVAAAPQYPCLHQMCGKRLYTRQDMVDHVEVFHPREARLYRGMLDEIMAQAAKDNPRVAEIARTYGQMQETGVQSVLVTDIRPVEKGLDVEKGKPVVTTMGIKKPDDDGSCGLCDWAPKPETVDRARARYMHLLVKHKDEV